MPLLQAIMTAARAGDLPAVQAEVEAEPAQANARDTHGQTALMWSAVKGWVHVAEYLLGKGADINAVETALGRTALYMACGRGHRAFAELLLARGADPGIRRHGGRTPLTIAAYNGHEPTLALLLRCCHDALEVADDERCTPLWYAARHGRTQALRLLLTAGADAWAAGEGDTLPLEVARSKGRLACVEALEGSERAYALTRARRLARTHRHVVEVMSEEGDGKVEADMVPEFLRDRSMAGSELPSLKVLDGQGALERSLSSEEAEKNGAIREEVLETPREREEAGGSCGGSREVTVAVVDHAVGGLSFDLFWELRTLLSH